MSFKKIIEEDFRYNYLEKMIIYELLFYINVEDKIVFFVVEKVFL